MTARLPSEPVRVTSWLAGWLDYVFATVLVAGRWLRAPFARTAPSEPAMLSAFAPAMVDSYGPRWHDAAPANDSERSSGIVKAAEIVMLSASFFLAAHLLSGGTPTVTAPDLNPLGLLPTQARAETQQIPAPTAKQVQVDATAFVYSSAPSTAETVAPEPPVVEAVLAPASGADTGAAAVATPAPEPPAAAIEPPPPAPPAPVAAATQPPVVDPGGRYLTSEEFRSYALAAGWAAENLDDLEYVAWCESRLFTHAEYLGARGLMQVLPMWFDYAGLDINMWHDPVTNLRAALAAYKDSERFRVDPWGAWTCNPANRPQ